MLYGAFGLLPPVGGPFACPLCVLPFPGFNPFFGKYPGICKTCL
ncbi:MAG TPA: hypothetical protein VIL07_13165 [Symbiobacteriaceae bacterium]